MAIGSGRDFFIRGSTGSLWPCYFDGLFFWPLLKGCCDFFCVVASTTLPGKSPMNCNLWWSLMAVVSPPLMDCRPKKGCQLCQILMVMRWVTVHQKGGFSSLIGYSNQESCISFFGVVFERRGPRRGFSNLWYLHRRPVCHIPSKTFPAS